MKILSSVLILGVMTSVVAESFKPVPTSAVSLIGGAIRARHAISEDAKHERKDCPVCKGKGWYISGDKISRVDCGYCEERSRDEVIVEPEEIYQPEEDLVTPPTTPKDPPLVPVPPKQFILRK
jgi:hypothetical protein